MNSEFNKALWDDSDPTYAPFLKTRKGKYFYWVPSKNTLIKDGRSHPTGLKVIPEITEIRKEHQNVAD